MKWDNLTMSQKQALMKIYVNNGVTNLDEIRNHYNRFDDGGYKEITLPEVVVTPEEWQKDFSKNFGNENIRSTLYHTMPSIVDDLYLKEKEGKKITKEDLEAFRNTNDYTANIERLYHIWNAAGRPKIKETDFLRELGLNNPHYNPVFNTIVARTPSDIVSELAHPILEENKDFSYKEYLKFPESVRSFLSKKKATKLNKKGKADKAKELMDSTTDVYHNPNHYEYKTHEIVEPALKDYILNGTNLDFNNIPINKFDNVGMNLE